MTQQSSDGTAYQLTGAPDAPVIALIHGLGLCSKIWNDHLPAFHHYRVLNYDLYGHGDSAPPPQQASLAVYAKQLSTLLNELQIPRASIVGFSIGGMINRRFALDFPERLESLVILNSPHDRGETAQQQVEQRAAKVRDEGKMATLPDALIRWFTRAYIETHEDTLEHVRQWRRRVDDESYAQAAWVLANGVRELIRPQPPVSAPALVMTCENDSGSTPAMSHAIAAEIAGAQTRIVPRLQHLGLMEEPAAFTTPIIEFLNTVYT